MNKIAFSMMVIISAMLMRNQAIDKETPAPATDYLTERTWLVDELTYLQNGQLIHYQRGTSSDQFLNDRIFFSKDSNGIYTNTYNQQFRIKWSYTDLNKKKIELIIYDYLAGTRAEGKRQKVKLENVNVTAGSLSYSEIYYTNGRPTMSSVYRVPVKK